MRKRGDLFFLLMLPTEEGEGEKGGRGPPVKGGVATLSLDGEKEREEGLTTLLLPSLIREKFLFPYLIRGAGGSHHWFYRLFPYRGGGRSLVYKGEGGKGPGSSRGRERGTTLPAGNRRENAPDWGNPFTACIWHEKKEGGKDGVSFSSEKRRPGSLYFAAEGKGGGGIAFTLPSNQESCSDPPSGVTMRKKRGTVPEGRRGETSVPVPFASSWGGEGEGHNGWFTGLKKACPLRCRKKEKGFSSLVGGPRKEARIFQAWPIPEGRSDLPFQLNEKPRFFLHRAAGDTILLYQKKRGEESPSLSRTGTKKGGGGFFCSCPGRKEGGKKSGQETKKRRHFACPAAPGEGEEKKPLPSPPGLHDEGKGKSKRSYYSILQTTPFMNEKKGGMEKDVSLPFLSERRRREGGTDGRRNRNQQMGRKGGRGGSCLFPSEPEPSKRWKKRK